MKIRAAVVDDLDVWVAMRQALWPEESADELRADAEAFFQDRGWRAATLLCEDEAGRAVGMIELSLRSYAEGCDSSPVPFVEGWFVVPDARRRGIGRALVAAAEVWARERGHREIASDTQLWNTDSQAAHLALGFEEAERAVHYRKSL